MHSYMRGAPMHESKHYPDMERVFPVAPLLIGAGLGFIGGLAFDGPGFGPGYGPGPGFGPGFQPPPGFAPGFVYGPGFAPGFVGPFPGYGYGPYGY